MNRINRFTVVCLLVLLTTSEVALSQISEARRYFPHATGNLWRWVSTINPSTYDSEITKDSTDAGGTIFVFYNGATSPRYRIDTTGNVYQFVGPSVVLWFKLAAQHGDSFYTWNDGYKIKVTVHNETLFGHPTVTKVFTWYLNPPGTYMYARQSLARDFGMIRTYAELGPLDDYVTGCIIDSIRYGSLVSVPREQGDLPPAFALEQNYPNPFNPTTRIRFRIQVPGFTSLKVYDILGREVRTLVNEQLEPGSYETTFDAGPVNGAGGLASGTYFYKLRAGSFVQVRKMILTR